MFAPAWTPSRELLWFVEVGLENLSGCSFAGSYWSAISAGHCPSNGLAGLVAALERLSQLQRGSQGTNIGVRGITLAWWGDVSSAITRLVELAGPSLEELHLVLSYKSSFNRFETLGREP